MCAHTILEISKHAHELLKACLPIISGLIFFGTQEEDENINKMWKETWDDLLPNSTNGIKLYFEQINTLLSQSLNSQSWNIRKQAAVSYSLIATTLSNFFFLFLFLFFLFFFLSKGNKIIEFIDKTEEDRKVLENYSGPIISQLCEILTGRVWKGKELLLQSLCDVAITSKNSVDPKPIFDVILFLIFFFFFHFSYSFHFKFFRLFGEK